MTCLIYDIMMKECIYPIAFFIGYHWKMVVWFQLRESDKAITAVRFSPCRKKQENDEGCLDCGFPAL